jgi:hypothetical protein
MIDQRFLKFTNTTVSFKYFFFVFILLHISGPFKYNRCINLLLNMLNLYVGLTNSIIIFFKKKNDKKICIKMTQTHIYMCVYLYIYI